jgi:hypothetical protein
MTPIRPVYLLFLETYQLAENSTYPDHISTFEAQALLRIPFTLFGSSPSKPRRFLPPEMTRFDMEIIYAIFR